MDTRKRTEGPFFIPVSKVIETRWIDSLMLLITSETQYKSDALRKPEVHNSLFGVYLINIPYFHAMPRQM